MDLERMFLSNKVLIPLGLVILISLSLTFFPLVGTLGFEYSVVMGFVLAFISVFISAELIDSDYKIQRMGRRLSDRVSSILTINIIFLLVVFLIGLGSSLIKGDCYKKEGAAFFLLIPVVSVFFSSTLGLLTGFIFRGRGFFTGALIIIGTIIYSLWKLYSNPSLFVYNPVFGFFPGPIYDEAIPVTLTLVVYRIITVLWGFLFLTLLTIANGMVFRRIGAWGFIKLFIFAAALVISYSYKQEIGFTYSREYITESILPASVETDNFIIYYDPGATRDIDLIARDHEWRYKQLSEFLDTDSSQKIRSYIYPDFKTRKNVVGAGETTIANPIHKEIHLVYDLFPHPVLKHELTHVMSADFGSKFLKISPKIGLLEGLAVAADWDGDGYTRHQWAKLLIKKGAAPQLNNILGFGFWYAPPAVGYTLTGSFSRYLIDTYGMDKFKTAYRTGNFSVYGKGLDELITEWKVFLEGIETPLQAEAIAEARFSEPSIFGATCPRRVAALKTDGYRSFSDSNYHRARLLFEEALSYDADDPVLLNGLAYSNYYEGNYPEAARVAKRSASISEVDKTILENLRGNALWQSGKTNEALVIFKSIRGNPLPDEIKRELDIKISAIETGGEPAGKLREFFSTRDRVYQTVSLEESVMLSPDYSPAYYLLGRMLYNNGEYKKAVPYLTLAKFLGLPSDELTGENSRLLGISLFAGENYEGSADIFREITASDGSSGSRNYALDFIERARWAKEKRLK
ncbi:MAG: hypothetical protein RIG61_11135 [Deltaproteobacteria bacterium]